MNIRKLQGFTLVELLVVIAIIGVLVALLLPAVQAAREAARRTSCNNNLKNIGIALHDYHDTKKVFPPGWIIHKNASGKDISKHPGWGWTVQLLPFVEEESLFNSLRVNEQDLKQAIADPATRKLTTTILPIYRCPSDTIEQYLRKPDRTYIHTGWPTDYEPGASNYMGSSGIYDPSGSTRFLKMDGMFTGNRSFTMRDAEDGATNTFFVGERDLRCKAGAWPGARNPPGPDTWGSYFVRARVTIKLNDPICCNAKGQTRANNCTEGFSSKHKGGANFLFVDGSVRFIDENIQYSHGTMTRNDIKTMKPYGSPGQLGIYQKLGSRKDKQTVGDF